MKIPLTFADRKPTTAPSKQVSGGMGKRTPLNVPELSAASKAVGEAGRVAHDIYGRMINAQRQREQAQAITDMSLGFNEIYTEIAENKAWENEQRSREAGNQPKDVRNFADMTIGEHLKYFNDRAEVLRKNVGDKIKDLRTKDAMDVHFTKLSDNEKLKTEKVAWSREIDRSRATNTETLATLTNDFIVNGNTESLAKGEAVINSAVSAGTFNEQEGVALRNQFQREAFTGYWGRAITENPVATRITLFKKGLDKEGNLVLKDNKDLPLMFQAKGADGKDLVTEEERMAVAKAAREAWGPGKQYLAQQFDQQIDELRESYIASVDPKNRKTINNKVKRIVDESVDIGIFSAKEGATIYKNFRNESIDTDWRRQSDRDPELTFNEAFVKIGDRPKDINKYKGPGFMVKGKKGLWAIKKGSKFYKESRIMDEENERVLELYLRKNYEDWYSRWSFGMSKKREALTEFRKDNGAQIRQTGKPIVSEREMNKMIREYNADDPEYAEKLVEKEAADTVLNISINKYSDEIMKASRLPNSENPDGVSDEMKIINEIGNFPEQKYDGTKLKRLTEKEKEALKEKNIDPTLANMSPYRREIFMNSINQAVQQKTQALAKDPVVYVNSTFKDELDVATTPQERNDILITSQEFLGVPKSNISLLSNTQAEVMVNDLSLLEGEQKVKAIQEFTRNFTPKQYRVAYRDLVNAKLPIGTQFLVAQDKPGQAIIRQKYGKVLNMKEQELKDALGTRAKGVTDTFDIIFEAEFKDYRRSVLNQGGGEIDNDVMNGVKEMIKKAVMLDARNEDADVKELTRNYVQKSFNDVYNYNIKNGYRIPATYNEDNVSIATEEMLKNITDKLNVVVLGSQYPGLSYDHRKMLYINDLKSNGRWVNTPDNQGLMLVDQNNQPVQIFGEIINQETTMDTFRVSFDELNKLGLDTMAERKKFAKEEWQDDESYMERQQNQVGAVTARMSKSAMKRLIRLQRDESEYEDEWEFASGEM